MSLTIPEIRKSIKEILETNDPEIVEFLRKRLSLLLVSCLSPNQKTILNYMEGRDWFTTEKVAKSLGWQPNYVSNQLKELTEAGLVERQPITGRYGLHYEWRRTPLP